MDRLSKNCVAIEQKGEVALLSIAILPEFCQGMFPKISLQV